MCTQDKRAHHHAPWLCALILVLLSPACTQAERPGPSAGVAEPEVPAATEDPVLRARMEKDEAFRNGSDSPLLEPDRPRFQGLAYFALNPALRFTVKLNRYPRPERIRLGTNTGEMRNALRYGYFEFEADGRRYRLQVYRTDDSTSSGKPYLFIPFRDGTSGRESYGGGRYLDLEENTTGIYELDFNRAYNPLCAYGRDYSCPLPPEENRLEIAIRAGEKVYAPAAEP